MTTRPSSPTIRASDTSTYAAIGADPAGRHRNEVAGRWVRRAALAGVSVFVVCGALGLFGYRSATERAVAGAYSVELIHPAVTRGGLAADWRLRLERTDGGVIDEPVDVATSLGYLAAFDQNAQLPEPDATAQDGTTTRWTYAAPGTPELVIRLDIRTQPGTHGSRAGRTVVQVGGQPVAELEYSTWIAP